MSDIIDVKQEMAGASLTGLHVRFALLIGAVLFMDGYDLFNAAYVAPYVKTLWGLSPYQVGLMLSAGLVGLSAGALIQGPLADKIGRRATMILGVWVLGLSSLALATLSFNFEIFCLLRLVLGLSLGMLSPLSFIYINEWAPARIANRYATWSFVVPFSLGGIAAGLAGLFIAPAFGWHALYFVGALAIPLAGLCSLVLPESVQFLALRGKLKEVRTLLTRARPERALAYRSAATFISGEPAATHSGLPALFQPKYLGVTLILWAAGVLSLFCVHGLSGWLPSIIIGQGGAVKTGFTYGTVLMVTQILGGVVCGTLADRFGRVAVMAVGFVGGGGSLLLLAFLIHSPNAIIGVACAGFCIFGAQAVMNNFIAVSYESSVRGLAVGLCVGVNRMGGILGPILIGYTQGLPNALWATMLMLVTAQVLAAAIISLAGKRPGPTALPVET